MVVPRLLLVCLLTAAHSWRSTHRTLRNPAARLITDDRDRKAAEAILASEDLKITGYFKKPPPQKKVNCKKVPAPAHPPQDPHTTVPC